MLPAVLAADGNAGLAWCRSDDGLQVHGQDGNALRMFDKLRRRDLVIMPPGEEQKGQPTSRPRKTNVKGRIIDFISNARVRTGSVVVATDSYQVIGTDHEFLAGKVFLHTSQPGYKRFDTRPRYVRGEPEIQMVDQEALCQMAKSCTRPKSTSAYKDSVEVRGAFREARRVKTAAAWKAAFKKRNECRKAWEEGRLTQAAEGNWVELRRARHVNGVWETGFAEATEGQPHQVIHQHLAAVYAGDPLPRWEPKHVEGVEPFSMTELHEACARGGRGKSVGADGIPHKLLVYVAQHHEGGPKLLAWFNRILETGIMPSDWAEVVMIILPKITRPKEAKHVRPISMGSATCKLFSRMLLECSLPIIGEPDARQCAGRQRQTLVYLFSIIRVLGLEREWRLGRLARDKLFSMIANKLGDTQLTRCWRSLLVTTTAFLQTSWSRSTVLMNTVIKQGAIESPCLFSMVAAMCLRDAEVRLTLGDCDPKMPSLQLRDILFMDDGIVWDSDVGSLQTRVNAIAEVFSEWGLSLNVEKCQWYKSPHAQGSRQLHILGHAIQPTASLEVMGLSLTVDSTPSEMVAPLMARARDAFWAMEHILHRRAISPGLTSENA